MKWNWTGKLPLLLAGLALIGAGLVWFAKRPWTWPAFALIAIGICLVVESEQMGDWCRPHETTFGSAFGGQFTHHSLSDCWKLVHNQ